MKLRRYVVTSSLSRQARILSQVANRKFQLFAVGVLLFVACFFVLRQADGIVSDVPSFAPNEWTSLEGPVELRSVVDGHLLHLRKGNEVYQYDSRSNILTTDMSNVWNSLPGKTNTCESVIGERKWFVDKGATFPTPTEQTNAINSVGGVRKPGTRFVFTLINRVDPEQWASYSEPLDSIRDDIQKAEQGEATTDLTRHAILVSADPDNRGGAGFLGFTKGMTTGSTNQHYHQLIDLGGMRRLGRIVRIPMVSFLGDKRAVRGYDELLSVGRSPCGRFAVYTGRVSFCVIHLLAD